MANVIPKRVSDVAAAIETTKGTTESVSAADATFNLYDAVFKETTPYVAREKQGSSGMLPGVNGARMGTASFWCYLENSGTATLPTWATTFLPPCGYINSSGVFTRTLDTSAQKALTLVKYNGTSTTSIKQTIAGATGKFRVDCPNGAPAKIFFDFSGKYTTETTGTLIAPTKVATNPPRGFESFTINSVSQLAPLFTIDFGQMLKLLEGPNDTNATGYVHGVIADYKPKLTCEPYAELLSVIDWRARFAANTESALSCVIGTGSNNVITIAASKLQLTASPDYGEREGLMTRSLAFDINDDLAPTIAFS